MLYVAPAGGLDQQGRLTLQPTARLKTLNHRQLEKNIRQVKKEKKTENGKKLQMRQISQ